MAQAEKEIPDQDRRDMAASWREEPPTEKQIRLLFTVNRELRGQFQTPEKLWQFCLERFHAGDGAYSRGSISKTIDSFRAARP